MFFSKLFSHNKEKEREPKPAVQDFTPEPQPLMSIYPGNVVFSSYDSTLDNDDDDYMLHLSRRNDPSQTPQSTPSKPRTIATNDPPAIGQRPPNTMPVGTFSISVTNELYAASPSRASAVPHVASPLNSTPTSAQSSQPNPNQYRMSAAHQPYMDVHSRITPARNTVNKPSLPHGSRSLFPSPSISGISTTGVTGEYKVSPREHAVSPHRGVVGRDVAATASPASSHRSLGPAHADTSLARTRNHALPMPSVPLPSVPDADERRIPRHSHTLFDASRHGLRAPPAAPAATLPRHGVVDSYNLMQSISMSSVGAFPQFRFAMPRSLSQMPSQSNTPHIVAAPQPSPSPPQSFLSAAVGEVTIGAPSAAAGKSLFAQEGEIPAFTSPFAALPEDEEEMETGMEVKDTASMSFTPLLAASAKDAIAGVVDSSSTALDSTSTSTLAFTDIRLHASVPGEAHKADDAKPTNASTNATSALLAHTASSAPTSTPNSPVTDLPCLTPTNTRSRSSMRSASRSRSAGRAGRYTHTNAHAHGHAQVGSTAGATLTTSVGAGAPPITGSSPPSVASMTVAAPTTTTTTAIAADACPRAESPVSPTRSSTRPRDSLFDSSRTSSLLVRVGSAAEASPRPHSSSPSISASHTPSTTSHRPMAKTSSASANTGTDTSRHLSVSLPHPPKRLSRAISIAAPFTSPLSPSYATVDAKTLIQQRISAMDDARPDCISPTSVSNARVMLTDLPHTSAAAAAPIPGLQQLTAFTTPVSHPSEAPAGGKWVYVPASETNTVVEGLNTSLSSQSASTAPTGISFGTLGADASTSQPFTATTDSSDAVVANPTSLPATNSALSHIHSDAAVADVHIDANDADAALGLEWGVCEGVYADAELVQRVGINHAHRHALWMSLSGAQELKRQHPPHYYRDISLLHHSEVLHWGSADLSQQPAEEAAVGRGGVGIPEKYILPSSRQFPSYLSCYSFIHPNPRQNAPSTVNPYSRQDGNPYRTDQYYSTIDLYTPATAGVRSLPAKKPPFLNFEEEIRKDLLRTLPEQPLFRTNETLMRLYRILACYTVRSPEAVGYCQSMNFLAATLFLTLLTSEMSKRGIPNSTFSASDSFEGMGAPTAPVDSFDLLPVEVVDACEEDSFWLLCILIESRMGYYSRHMCGIDIDMQVLSVLIKYHCPAITAHLNKHEININVFAVTWFLSVFFIPLGIARLPRAWDMMLLCGDECMFSLTITILLILEPYIVTLNSTEDLLCFFLHPASVMRALHDIIQHNTTLADDILPSSFSSTPAARPSLSVVDYIVRCLPLNAYTHKISSLRMLYKNQILAKCSNLSLGVARRYALQHGFTRMFTDDESKGKGGVRSASLVDVEDEEEWQAECRYHKLQMMMLLVRGCQAQTAIYSDAIDSVTASMSAAAALTTQTGASASGINAALSLDTALATPTKDAHATFALPQTAPMMLSPRAHTLPSDRAIEAAMASALALANRTNAAAPQPQSNGTTPLPQRGASSVFPSGATPAMPAPAPVSVSLSTSADVPVCTGVAGASDGKAMANEEVGEAKAVSALANMRAADEVSAESKAVKDIEDHKGTEDAKNVDNMKAVKETKEAKELKAVKDVKEVRFPIGKSRTSSARSPVRSRSRSSRGSVFSRMVDTIAATLSRGSSPGTTRTRRSNTVTDGVDLTPVREATVRSASAAPPVGGRTPFFSRREAHATSYASPAASPLLTSASFSEFIDEDTATAVRGTEATLPPMAESPLMTSARAAADADSLRSPHAQTVLIDLDTPPSPEVLRSFPSLLLDGADEDELRDTLPDLPPRMATSLSPLPSPRSPFFLPSAPETAASMPEASLGRPHSPTRAATMPLDAPSRPQYARHDSIAGFAPPVSLEGQQSRQQRMLAQLARACAKIETPHPRLQSRWDVQLPDPADQGPMAYFELARAEDELMRQSSSTAALQASMSTVYVPPHTHDAPHGSDHEIQSLYNVSPSVMHAAERYIQVLWRQFLRPDPWGILLASCITDVCMFAQAFVPYAFTPHQRRRWCTDDYGICSGIADLLYHICDSTSTGRISFEDYMSFMAVFTCGTISQKLLACFKLFDIGQKGRVLYADLICVFTIINALYQGNGDNHAQAHEQSRVYADLICDRVDDLVAQMAAEAMIIATEAVPHSVRAATVSTTMQSAAVLGEVGTELCVVSPRALASSMQLSTPQSTGVSPDNPRADHATAKDGDTNATTSTVLAALAESAPLPVPVCECVEVDWDSVVECPCTCENCLECNLYIHMKRHALALARGTPEHEHEGSGLRQKPSSSSLSGMAGEHECLCSQMCRDRLMGWGTPVSSTTDEDAINAGAARDGSLDQASSQQEPISVHDFYTDDAEVQVISTPTAVIEVTLPSPSHNTDTKEDLHGVAAEATSVISRVQFPLSVRERGLTYFEFIMHIGMHPLTAWMFGIAPMTDIE